MRFQIKRQSVVLVLIFTALLALGLAARTRLQTLQSLPVNNAQAYVGSDTCNDCHQDRHESWHRTFHRTMTQQASAESVLGQFDGQSLTAFGGLVIPRTTPSGYAFEYRDPATGAELATLVVARTVGSHRYQQYLMRDADSETYYRLHYLWDMQDQRWVHMNAAFLGNDDLPFDAQVATWNANCVSCHNTGPQPKVSNMQELRSRAMAGERVDVRADMRFDTSVAELGIGCEACHGPGGAHLERMGQFDLRWLANWFAGSDRSIVNPERLPGARANDVCGACHAGRTLPNVAALDRWLQDGPSFRPGDDLNQHLRVVDIDTPSPSTHAPDLFRNRFWHDGSVRLTAYEYQGVKASACALTEEFTCIRCHSMHGGDPAGMLPEANRGDAPCLRCHQQLRQQVSAHTGHAADSTGSRCMNCHMPRSVYGVMTIHRSHQVNVPDVAADLAAGKPNACLNCHAEQAPAFALPKESGAGLGIARQDGADLKLADGLAGLFAGDPVRQAVTAFELGRVEQASSNAALLLRVPWLIEALNDDRPAVRRFALKSLRSIDQALDKTEFVTALAPALAVYDFTAEPSLRQQQQQAIAARFALVNKTGWPTPQPETALDSHYRLNPERLAELQALGQRSDKQIDIGE